ncbi:Basic helix-loop-helix DNA-binding superfamily protein isoform 1 [Hibiscus syriacus]|uniref:Basic helix-loop-helix DNA-binding superfamily protein isoform 1 n=1 Tax=Hibiscus syriacus TaxID=106335 RepID=A0A6A3CU14_HIBSY|nr:Basic helix-loop-helix DNA-binding superfamily protein isoform 1 [Hibiscus syriacus]
MKEKENRTPRKENPRSSDLAYRRQNDSLAKRTPKKIDRKSLTESFISPIEDVLPDISEESIDFSSISAFSDANFNIENAENLVISSNPLLLTSSETFKLSAIAPCSKINTANKDEQIDFSKTGLAEVGILVNLLKQARLQALDSVDMKNKSKKVLDALIEFTIKEFYTLPQERDKLPKVVPTNAYARFLCFLLCVVVVALFSLCLFCYSRSVSSLSGLPPT